MLGASGRKSYLIRKEMNRSWVAYLLLVILPIISSMLLNKTGREITHIIP